ncbi:MAG: ketoacyl-ACP synthase III [Clostridiaceae bacterium]|nr:ketoacyl-ACP synthase III [Clostridiaceae bacterium]
MNNSDYIFPVGSKKLISRFCKILSIASYIPEQSTSNDDIINDNKLPYKSNAILKSIGVERRHIAAEGCADSDVLFESAIKCLAKLDLSPDRLSRLIVNKYYGDNLLPMTASRLLGKLKCSKGIQSFDIDGGISSFLYSFDVASRFIATGDEYILLSSGGINTRLVSKTDPRVAFLFGDASASILFGQSDRQHILSSYFYSNPQFYELVTAFSPYMWSDALPRTEERFLELYDTYKIGNWKIAEDFIRESTLQIAHNILDESGLEINSIDLALVTENNIKIRELILDTLGIGEDKSISLIRDYGNTMSAMLPLLLDYGFSTGKIQEGMNIMLISLGEGISGGGLIYKV